MRGTVKFFKAHEGWGFINYSKGKDIFVHHSNIIMDGFRYLDEGDIVDFEIGSGNDGKKQAVNVTPILTMKMVEDALKEKNLFVWISPDARNAKKYTVIDERNVVQQGKADMTLVELADFAGIDVSGLAG